MRCYACNTAHPFNHDHMTGRWYCTTCQNIIDKTIGKSLDIEDLCDILDVWEDELNELGRFQNTPDVS